MSKESASQSEECPTDQKWDNSTISRDKNFVGLKHIRYVLFYEYIMILEN